MGPGRQYPLVPDDRQAFVTAAVGYSYPYSKFRHFFHQPDLMRTSVATDELAGLTKSSIAETPEEVDEFIDAQRQDRLH
jgi:hypothetical protein